MNEKRAYEGIITLREGNIIWTKVRLVGNPLYPEVDAAFDISELDEQMKSKDRKMK